MSIAPTYISVTLKFQQKHSAKEQGMQLLLERFLPVQDSYRYIRIKINKFLYKLKLNYNNVKCLSIKLILIYKKTTFWKNLNSTLFCYNNA